MSDDYQWYNQVDTNKRESDINNRDIVPLTYKDGTTEYHYRGTAYKTEQEAIRAQQGPAWFNKAAGFVGKTLMSSPTISTVAKTVAPVLQNEFVQDALTGPGEDTVITHVGDSLVQYGLPRNLAEVGRAVYPGPMDAKAPKIKPTGLTPAPIGVVDNVPTYSSINRVDTNIPTVYEARTSTKANLIPEDPLISTLHPKKGGGDKLAREVLSGDNLTGDALELKNLILEQDKALKSAPIAELADGTKIKVSSLSKAEVEALGVRIRTLKENLGLKSTSKYETYTGAFVIDGHIARLNSKGKLVTTKQQASRDLLEKLFPADESLLQDRYNISSKAGLTHKHHVRILEPSKVFGVVSDGKGGFAARDAGQLERVTKRLRENDNIHLGNQNLNEIMQSRLAHLGEKGDELSKYASHVQARGLTDLQGRTLADADFLQVILKKGDGNPVWVQQIKNKDGIITDFKLRNGDSIKAGNIKETVKYKLFGMTYDPKAVHGFSEEGIELLSKIKGDDELYEAIKLFYQTTDEGFKGVAGVASKLIDKGKTVDSLTKELLVQYSPEVQNWIKYMQTLPQFKNDRRLLEVMLQNKLDLYKLDLRYERPLKSLPKSDGRRHIGGR